jgi:hypothetical protein
MQAPTFVISVTAHGRTPVCTLKNSNALLAIFVLPIDLRSFVAVMRVLNDFLVDPAASVMTPPYLSRDKPAANRSPREDHRPAVPDLRPFWPRVLRNPETVVAARNQALGPSGRTKPSGGSIIARRLRHVVPGRAAMSGARDGNAFARRRNKTHLLG